MTAILILFLLMGWSFSLQSTLSSSEIEIIAHYKEKTGNRIFASEDVEIRYKNITLFADKVELDIETKDVWAEGNVVLHLPREVVSVESIRFNLNSTEGRFENVHGMIQPSIRYEADAMERKSDNLYTVEKAQITSCSQPVPRWNFSCSKANFKKDDYIEMWNTLVKVKKIPVFYFPYFRYPFDKDKATGFLMPGFGFSGTKGFYYSQSFYWNIRRNMDATFTLDYYASRGLGGGLEYRYIFREGLGGNIKLYSFWFKNDPESADPEVANPANAYIIRLQHNQPLPFDFKLVADVDYQSSFDFLREFDNNFKRAVVSNRRSQVYLSRSWSYFNLSVRASRTETYYSQTDRTLIMNNLPEIHFSSSLIKLFSPLYFSFSSSFKRWERGYQSEFEKDKQTHSQSFSLSPTLTFPFKSIPWLSVTSAFSANLSYYFQTFLPGTNSIVDEPVMSKYFTGKFELVGPVFSKIFFDEDNNPKLKHIIEPTFSYKYDSPVVDSEQIVTTRFFYRNHYFLYGLNNRFLVKQNKMPREILTLGINQTFYLEPDQSPLQYFEFEGEIPEFSDINASLRFYPTSHHSLDFSASFNPFLKNFSRLRLGLSLGSPNDRLFLKVNWYKSINPYKGNALPSRHQINFYWGFKIPSISLEALAEADFNIVQKELLYSAASLIYNYQCINLRADVRIFFFREQPEFQFRFSFEFGNIGKTTDFFGGIGF